MSLTIDELKALVAAQDDAQRDAARKVRDAHQSALDGAEIIIEELGGRLTAQAKRTSIAGMVEDAVGKPSKADRDVLTTILAQYVQVVAQRGSVTPSQTRSGRFLVETFARFSTDFSHHQRAKIAQALILASRGEVETGLVGFNSSRWHEAVRDADIEEAWGDLLAADQMASFRDAQQDLAEQYATARRYADALRQAKPCLFTVEADGEAVVSVQSHRPGDIGLKNLTFAGGQINELKPEQFAEVRDDRVFQSLLADGTLEVVAAPTLAREVAA